MTKRSRGRPKGSTGKAAILCPDQVVRALHTARHQGKYSDRAEVALALSIELGLRATELAALRWADVRSSDGTVRQSISVSAAYSTNARTFLSPVPSKLRGRLADYYEKHALRQYEGIHAPLFRLQRGRPMTAVSLARLITELYRKTGIRDGSSRSGRAHANRSIADQGN